MVIILLICVILLGIFIPYKYYQIKIRRKKYKEQSYTLLKIFDEILTKNNIPYMIIAGTLLGSVRHKDVIPWDHDVDVAIWKEDLPRYLELENEFRKRSLRYGYREEIHKIYSDKEPMYSYMDVFVFEMIDGHLTYDKEKWRKVWPKEYFLPGEVFPLKRYQFGPLKLLGPQKAVPYLERSYGNWKKGKKDFLM